MIVIADSGSTKTHWAYKSPQEEWKHISTPGMNPLTSAAEGLRQSIASLASNLNGLTPKHIFFYGAGCGTEEARTLVCQLLNEAFPTCTIEVNTDLMGACRALCGTDAGIIGILGTGSNACRYDGHTITSYPPSLGYLLGDEGSGNHIGRFLLKDYLRGLMPLPLANQFQTDYNINYTEVIHHLYHKSDVNRFLAGFAPFAARHCDHPYIQQLLNLVFDQYIETQILPLTKTSDETLHLVGSVADVFCNILGQRIQCHGLTLGNIIQDPMERLMRYHQAE